MKLRSHSIQERSDAQNILTQSNLSSFLLQLPQELKNQIYTYLLGGKCIHVEEARYKNTKRPYLLWPCRIKTAAPSSSPRDPDAETDDGTDYETHYDTDNDSDAKSEKPSASDPHRECYKSISQQTYSYRKRSRVSWYKHPTPPHPKPLHLSLNLLLTCRQTYHEAHSILYSFNQFSFQHPTLLAKFTSHLSTLPCGSQTLAPRHLHLHMDISTTTEEGAWNRALRTVVFQLTSLNSVDISIDLATWNHLDLGVGDNKNAAMSKRTTFLSGLAEFRELTLLKHMTLAVSEYRGREVVEPKEGKSFWLEVQGGGPLRGRKAHAWNRDVKS